MKMVLNENNMVIIENNNGEKILFSYTTPVAAIHENGVFEKLWYGWSVTTMKHINKFRQMYGYTEITKKEWQRI